LIGKGNRALQVIEDYGSFSSSVVRDKRKRSKTSPISPLPLPENQFFHTFSVTVEWDKPRGRPIPSSQFSMAILFDMAGQLVVVYSRSYSYG
jgi:hypothetical protein